MQYTISVLDLTRRAFGFTGGLPLSSKDTEQPSGRTIKVFEVDDAAASSAYGTPYFDRVSFYLGETLQLELLDPAVITVTKAKVIERTKIAKRDGTNKEFINKDDARITLQGLIVHEQDKLPVSEMERYDQVLDEGVTYKIVSSFLNALGITAAVIESHEFSPMENTVNVIRFSVSMLSDDSPELVL